MSKNLIFLISRAILLISLVSACAQNKLAATGLGGSLAESQTPPVPAHAFQTANPDQETIAIVAMNDFHGALLAKERKLPDGRVVESGGADALAGMIQILREEMPGRVAIIDAGDEWQGTMESNLSKGATVVEFYNRLGVDVAAIGNHEFDFGTANMGEQFSKANYPYVASNIFKKKGGARPTWKHVLPSDLIAVDGIKIGVIGVSTRQTPTTTRYENVADVNFVDAVKPVTSESKKLKKAGANLVLVTAHAGTRCEDKLGLKNWQMWTESTPNSSCDEEEEIVKLVNDLKPGTIDGVISGHTHQIIHHFIGHIPVVQDEAFNQFFNIIYFTFDRKTKALIPSLTQIEGLIPICFQFFAGTSHCDVRRLAKGVSPKLVEATFHGKQVRPNPEIEAWLAPIRASTDKYRKKVVGFTELPLTHYRDQESPFGNLMADVLREESKADMAIVNSGGIRTSLDAGPITYDGLYRALPFDNLLNVVKMTGAQVKLMFRLATSGTHGYPGFSGVKLTVIPLDQDAPQTDLNHDGKLEKWETNHLLKVEMNDGTPVMDKKIYTVATYDFLVTGGDNMKFLMEQIPKSRIDTTHAAYCRDLAIDYFKHHPRINTKEHPLVDPANPRIIFGTVAR
jgi:5'-nucleotidase